MLFKLLREQVVGSGLQPHRWKIFRKLKLKIKANSGIIKTILPKEGEFVWIRFWLLKITRNCLIPSAAT